jgi:hypothetical protein
MSKPPPSSVTHEDDFSFLVQQAERHLRCASVRRCVGEKLARNGDEQALLGMGTVVAEIAAEPKAAPPRRALSDRRQGGRTTDDDELRVGNRLLELTCDAERRARVLISPDQEDRRGDVGQEIALVGLGHQWQLRLESLGADGASDLLQERDELCGWLAGEQSGNGGVELPVRRCEHFAHPATRARTSSSDSDPFQPAYVSTRMRVATTSACRR